MGGRALLADARRLFECGAHVSARTWHAGLHLARWHLPLVTACFALARQVSVGVEVVSTPSA